MERDVFVDDETGMTKKRKTKQEVMVRKLILFVEKVVNQLFKKILSVKNYTV
jgi:hypothetical protein